MSLPFYLVNAFTLPTSPHSGNQAAVVVLPASHPKEADDEWKQLTARDFNFAETAFVTKREDGKWGLRWWTPAVEVTLCGHATLAAATALFTLHPAESSVTFTTRWAGDLVATRRTTPPSSGSETKPSLDVSISLPALDAEALKNVDGSQTSQLFQDVTQLVLAAAPKLGGPDAVKDVFGFQWGGEDSVIVQLESSVDIAALKVDLKTVLEISKGLVILTQVVPGESSSGRLVIRSRVFAPGVGIDEDPVTGAAHAFLTSYYTSPTIFAQLPSSVTEGSTPETVVLDAYQMSERQGRLECRLEKGGRVELVGRGVIWGKGDLSL
ncbi:uncharacterized protein MKK02DRAFT_43747 [Dioszegia hungarica]|uniref:Diaminopimelate epimerase-like protein n=1 Tax=Dioszegia hungarica TaxID=4972 RepID=A0AA38LRY2_9TREE|nr:uncharacterized protein MKK02DRAFT_43747 [Dioszegia hungarica]KAI9635067.1 hypothetical protein MKK02DRAFT_43747 [Dioszegia hungarica]